MAGLDPAIQKKFVRDAALDGCIKGGHDARTLEKKKGRRIVDPAASFHSVM
jgi:hypothetical protein